MYTALYVKYSVYSTSVHRVAVWHGVMYTALQSYGLGSILRQ